MEPGIREFLKRIVNAMSMVLLWMFINATAGIKFGWAFPENEVKWFHVVFYIWFVISLGLLVWYLIGLRRKPFKVDE